MDTWILYIASLMEAPGCSCTMRGTQTTQLHSRPHTLPSGSAKSTNHNIATTIAQTKHAHPHGQRPPRYGGDGVFRWWYVELRPSAQQRLLIVDRFMLASQKKLICFNISTVFPSHTILSLSHLDSRYLKNDDRTAAASRILCQVD
jgi:hypothetical protein